MKNLCQRLFDRLGRARADRQRAQQAVAQRTALLQDLAECRCQLHHTEQLFDMVTDPLLLDSCVYQQRALQARYDGLVLQARQLGITAWQKPALPVQKQKVPAAVRAARERCAP